MSNAGVDDAIQNVSRFCGVLSQTAGQLQSLSSAFEAFATQLGQTEDTTEQQWNQLSEGLRTLIQTADSAADDVAGEVASLATAAGELASSRLASVAQELQTAEDGLTTHLREARESLSQRFDGVEDKGYEPAKTKLNESVTDIDNAQTEIDNHVSTAVNGLQTAEGHLDTAESDLTQAIADATTTIDDAESHFEDASKAAEALDDDAVSTAQTEESDLTGLYSDFETKVQDAAQKLADAATSAIQEVADSLEREIKDKLETEIQSQAMQAKTQCETEIDALDGALKTCETETSDLPRLVTDLELAKRKVVELDEVLRSMEQV